MLVAAYGMTITRNGAFAHCTQLSIVAFPYLEYRPNELL